MPQLVKKRRSGWAVLAAGALVASLLAVGAGPAAAIDDDSEQDHKATATACLGEALDDHGFTDLGSLEAAVPNINCLAYYGITVGKTADTFDPNANVTRRQMALFLYRAANLMGVDLMGGDMAADFGDISELDDDSQSAIMSLASNGILDGRGDMAFEPGADITRAEMAVALVSLLDHVSGNLGKNDDGLFVFGDDEDLPNDNFADAYASVPAAVNNAISAAYELGITSGVGDGTSFNPSGTVPRRDMATFIIRALNHSNVRPAGMTAQVHTRPMGAAEIVVSVRDADFAPAANVPIDAFRASAPQEDRAFKQDGSCSSRTTRVDGANKCMIDGADPVTTSLGNIGLAQLSATDIGEDGLTVWLWTGDIGDDFGNDTEALEISVDPQPQMAAGASVAAISSDLGLKGAGDARYGQTVTFTIQLQDNEENDAATPDGGVKYTLRLETFTGRQPVTTANAPVSVTPDEVELGSDGSGTFVVTARDLDPNNKGEVTVRYTLTRTVTDENDDESAPNLLVPGVGTVATSEVQPATNPETYTHTKFYRGVVVFSDADAKVAAVSVDAADHQSTPSGNNPVGTAATVTVLDQYGRPMSGEGIVLDSDADTDSTTSSRPRFTGPNGQVRIGYSYGGGAAVETLTAIWDGDTSDQDGDGTEEGTGEGEGDDTECQDIQDDGSNDGGNDICGSTTVFWVGAVTDENSATVTASTDDQEITGPADVLSHDADNQQIVIDSDADADDDGERAPSSMSYDSNDFFQVDGSPTTMAEFVETLDKALAAFETASDDTNINQVEPTLVWSDYVYDDSSSSAWFRLASNLATNEPSS